MSADEDAIRELLGSHHKGRDAIAASYVALFKKLLKGSRLDTAITQMNTAEPTQKGERQHRGAN
jgi:hypothetical protein